MFVSPCSLRSTQCAALIALATAAGIMRVEVAEARSSDARTTKTETNRAAHVAFPRSTQTARFQIAFDAVAPWLALFQVAAQLTAESSAGIAAPLPSTAPAATLPFPPLLCCGPTARQHSYPFAIGPPARDAGSSTRADDTSVSLDSAARRIAVSRVAVVSFSSLTARLTRLGTPGPKLAGMFSSPSSALRGETAPFPSLSAPTKATALSGRTPCDRPPAAIGS